LSNTAYSYTIVPVNASGSTGASYTTPSPFTTAIGNTVNTFSNALTISPAPPIAPDRISVTPGGRMLVVGYATLMYWTQYNASNNTWGSWTATGEPNVRGYLGLDTTADGNRGVAAVQNVGCFFFTWTGSNYSALTQTLDGTVRNYQGIAVSANGSTLVASAFNDYIYFASWNGANYGSFTRTLEPYSRPYIGIGISADGSRLAYGGDPAAPYANTSDPGVVYISVWNGTNYSAGVQTLNTTARSARNFYFSPNKNILWYATNSGASVAQTTGPAIFYAYTNNMTSSYYGTFNAVPAAAIPNNITAWGFCLSRSGNTLFAAPYANATIYQSTVTFSN
jgi:hypothetical protein